LALFGKNGCSSGEQGFAVRQDENLLQNKGSR
jgi:hypothetical protein